MLHTVDE